MLYPLIPLGGTVFWVSAIVLGLLCLLVHIGANRFAANRGGRGLRTLMEWGIGLFVAFVLLFGDIGSTRNAGGTMTIYELFVVGTFPFWALVLVEAAFLFAVVSYRWITPGIGSLVAFALALQFFGNVPVFPWMWQHWDYCLYIVLGWLGFAAPWAIVKWTLFVRDNSIRYDEILQTFLDGRQGWPANANAFTVEQKVEWKEYFDLNSHQDDAYEYVKVEFTPRARNHKADIMGWMVFLPFSFLWTILNDPIRKLFREMYRIIVGWLDSITNRYWKDKQGHMPTAEEIAQVQAARREKENAVPMNSPRQHAVAIPPADRQQNAVIPR
jgi:hypothetical protein